MKNAVLVVLGVFAAALLLASLSGKITGNAFAYNLPKSCTDSDGNDYYKQGEVEYKDLSFAGPKLKKTDSCVNEGYLLEYYCEGVEQRTETVPCRCENGACKRY